MRNFLTLTALAMTAPLAAMATPSMVGQWSCEHYSEESPIMGTVAYYNDGTSEGSFQATLRQEGTTVELVGAYRADWLQENTLLVETITWVDIQELAVNGVDFLNTPTEKAFEDGMMAEGKTFSQIIDSSEVMVVLEDSEGDISSCNLF
jgi:hypothetical protein